MTDRIDNEIDITAQILYQSLPSYWQVIKSESFWSDFFTKGTSMFYLIILVLIACQTTYLLISIENNHINQGDLFAWVFLLVATTYSLATDICNDIEIYRLKWLLKLVKKAQENQTMDSEQEQNN